MTNYLNHFYLLVLMQFLLIFLPGNALCSLDNLYFPESRRERMPRCYLLVLRYLMFIVYTYAGIVKVSISCILFYFILFLYFVWFVCFYYPLFLYFFIY
jgi:hypothetical protein